MISLSACRRPRLVISLSACGRPRLLISLSTCGRPRLVISLLQLVMLLVDLLSVCDLRLNYYNSCVRTQKVHFLFVTRSLKHACTCWYFWSIPSLSYTCHSLLVTLLQMNRRNTLHR